jgi:DNA-directed RNA polymerase specialized sigma24 family protein
MDDPERAAHQQHLYGEAVAAFGSALERLTHGYESLADARQDLLQEIHVALWRSFSSFKGQCSLRTWVYRVAHNTPYLVEQRQPATDRVEIEQGPGAKHLLPDWAHSASFCSAASIRQRSRHRTLEAGHDGGVG